MNCNIVTFVTPRISGIRVIVNPASLRFCINSTGPKRVTQREHITNGVIGGVTIGAK